MILIQFPRSLAAIIMFMMLFAMFRIWFVLAVLAIGTVWALIRLHRHLNQKRVMP